MVKALSGQAYLPRPTDVLSIINIIAVVVVVITITITITITISP